MGKVVVADNPQLSGQMRIRSSRAKRDGCSQLYRIRVVIDKPFGVRPNYAYRPASLERHEPESRRLTLDGGGKR